MTGGDKAVSTKTDRIGVLGLGLMGAGMAARIHAKGFPLTVCDIAEERCAPFRAKGVAVACSARELADAVDIVISCLPSVAVSRQVSCGPGGIIEGKAVSLYVETGTVGTAAMVEIGDTLAKAGIATIDGPVSGGQAGADQGSLSTILAGPADAVTRFRSIAEAYASHVFVVADHPGPAQTAKLVNNMLSITGMIAAFEGMVMGAKAGLDPQTMLDIINVSTGRNSATVEKIPARILTRKFGGHIDTGVKDLGLYISESAELDVPVWMATRALEVFRAAMENGIDHETMRIIQYMEALAGGVEVKARSATDAGSDPSLPHSA
jgi:3-hydroxyisobutyrate dehydrogenase-like beta-hydroxyacid dehydrogenase